jgi:hypothetical protein
LDVREGTIKRDIRTYDEYIADLRDEESRRVVSSGVALETDNEREKRLKQERYERVQELKREVRKIEKQLEDFSLKKERMLKVFADKPMETTPEQAREFNTIETVLAHAEAEWLRVQTELSVLGH